jgi:hypothetical protein
MMDLMPHDSTLLEREMYSEAEAGPFTWTATRTSLKAVRLS